MTDVINFYSGFQVEHRKWAAELATEIHQGSNDADLVLGTAQRIFDWACVSGRLAR